MFGRNSFLDEVTNGDGKDGGVDGVAVKRSGSG